MNNKVWDSPLAANVDRLMDEGHEVYIVGWTTEGNYALIKSSECYTVAPCGTVNGVGRWEWPGDRPLPSHVYERFPVR